jgi:hypothetical protein
MRMPETDRWLSEYGDNHREISSPAAYWPAVLLLVVGTVGMLWSLPVPAAFTEISPVLNWGSAFLMAAVVYYFILSLALAIGMLPFVMGVSALQVWLAASGLPLCGGSLAMVVLAVAGLWLGHRASGGLRAVFRDIQLMMIGPAWLLASLYRRLGIPY